MSSMMVEEKIEGGASVLVEQEVPEKAVAAPHSGASSSKLRFASLLMIAVYPLITALLYIVMPLTDGWDLWHRTIVITPVMVFAIVFIVSPAVNRHFAWFIATSRSAG